MYCLFLFKLPEEQLHLPRIEGGFNCQWKIRKSQHFTDSLGKSFVFIIILKNKKFLSLKRKEKYDIFQSSEQANEEGKPIPFLFFLRGFLLI